MANLTVTRTYVGSIQNHRQVSDGLDSLGDSASKIWTSHDGQPTAYGMQPEKSQTKARSNRT